MDNDSKKIDKRLAEIAQLKQEIFNNALRREEAYVQARIKENEKWHSWWKWLLPW